MSNGRSNSSQTHAHWSVTIYEVAFEFYIIQLLEIKTFGLVSRIRDVEVGCLKNHNFLL